MRNTSQLTLATQTIKMLAGLREGVAVSTKTGVKWFSLVVLAQNNLHFMMKPRG